MQHTTAPGADSSDMIRLAADLAEAVALARSQAVSTAQYKKMYDRSSLLAKIGVWECDLATNALIWTDGVYDLFELPRGSVVDRDRAAAMYDQETGREMERLRARAIATGGSFTLDARIRTALGNIRWMRLTADVECENGVPVRLFGAKQDITAEKSVWHRLQAMAERDPLTGLANRGVFDARIAEAEGGGVPIGAMLLVDLDGFKQINDTYGHGAGDECLRQSAARLKLAWPDAGLVARIGGDEFAVVLRDPINSDDLEDLIADLRRPVAWQGGGLPMSASVGVAAGEDAGGLFARADAALYAAKAAGRNTFRVSGSEVWTLAEAPGSVAIPIH